MRILVVEDDARVASFIRRGLREEGYAVDVASDGEDALFQAQTNDYDLLVLDLVLPKRSGLEVLKTLRADGITIPIIILTAKGDPQDKVTGLDTGADDYLAKPFPFDELLARVRALLRRRGSLTPTALQAADLECDVLRHRVTRDGKPIVLTSREFALLEYLLRHLNQVVTRTTLAEHVWEHDFDPLSNVINVHIARLRRKIDDGFTPKLLQTIHGRGYMLRVPENETRRSAPRQRGEGVSGRSGKP